MRPERNPTEARQAKPLRHMRYVLAISLAMAVLAMLIGRSKNDAPLLRSWALSL